VRNRADDGVAQAASEKAHKKMPLFAPRPSTNAAAVERIFDNLQLIEWS
jgi:hypothetical protein